MTSFQLNIAARQAAKKRAKQHRLETTAAEDKKTKTETKRKQKKHKHDEEWEEDEGEECGCFQALFDRSSSPNHSKKPLQRPNNVASPDQDLSSVPQNSAKKASSRSDGVPRTSSRGSKKSLRRKQKKLERNFLNIDTSKPLEFPTTPEMILAHHKSHPFLDRNEEWLLVELNEYECLVDNHDIIKVIAKHSKFFEVEPDELWEEFFDFVDDVPSYDEVINYDVWQEFRDNRYPC